MVILGHRVMVSLQLSGGVAHSTFVKWQAELDRECQTMSWFDCEVSMSGAKKIVAKLKCKVCVKFESKIAGRRNYSNKWIVRADSVRTSINISTLTLTSMLM